MVVLTYRQKPYRHGDICQCLTGQNLASIVGLDALITGVETAARDWYTDCRDAPVAQLDRASVYGTEGWGFESLRAFL